MLLAEIGADMDAFGSADRLASWGGICPGNNESLENLAGKEHKDNSCAEHDHTGRNSQ